MKNFDVHGVYPVCNTAAILISVDNDSDPINTRILWKWSNENKIHNVKVDSTMSGRAYFRVGNMRVYLDNVERV